MNLFANDLSLHGQFHDIPAFEAAFREMMKLREVARQFGWEVHCSRAFLNNAKPLQGISIQKAVGQLKREEQSIIMHWLGKRGPFWDDDLRLHGPDEYLESCGDVVTDSSVGEAAFRMLHNIECGLVSFSPSDWTCSPIVVRRVADEGAEGQRVAVPNWWTPVNLKAALEDAEPPASSWAQLQEYCVTRFSRLTFSPECFTPSFGFPFKASTAERIRVLLGILEKRANAFDSAGAQTQEGHRLHRDHFSGGNALFSDSSDTEKRDYEDELNFPHPDRPGQSIWCPWHGKERHLNLRLHFSWPIRPDEPVHVVYVGPKLTKR